MTGARGLATLAALVVAAIALRPRGSVKIVDIPECEPLAQQLVLREYQGSSLDGGF